MDIIYRLGQASAKEVQENLPDPPSYSAVRALLATLENKEMVKHGKESRRYIYKATINEKKARKSALQNLLSTFFDGKPQNLVAALLDKEDEQLSASEIAEIRKLVESLQFHPDRVLAQPHDPFDHGVGSFDALQERAPLDTLPVCVHAVVYEVVPLPVVPSGHLAVEDGSFVRLPGHVEGQQEHIKRPVDQEAQLLPHEVCAHAHVPDTVGLFAHNVFSFVKIVKMVALDGDRLGSREKWRKRLAVPIQSSPAAMQSS